MDISLSDTKRALIFAVFEAKAAFKQFYHRLLFSQMNMRGLLGPRLWIIIVVVCASCEKAKRGV